MRLERIFATNFLGARAVDIRTVAPVQLLCGANGAGKSSVRDAVALALTADLGRVALKKEATALITAGADLATCQVVDADGEIYAVSINAAGKITDSMGGRSHEPVLEYVLDAQRFARLDATARRAFLFGLMGLKTDGSAITERLLARGLDKAKVERIAPLLRAGFDAACKEAKSKATEAKGAWRATTGETYGSEKAKSWRAATPAVDAAAAQALAAELTKLDASVEGFQRSVGKMEGEQQRRQELSTKIATLQDLSARVERIRTKLATDEAELARMDSELETARAAAGTGKRHGLVHEMAVAMSAMLEKWWPFPDSQEAKVREAGAAVLKAYEAAHGPLNATGGDPAAAARIPALEQARATAQRAVDNDRRDLEAAQRAAGEIEAIRKELATPFDAELLEISRREVEKRKAKRAELIEQQDKLKAQQAAAAAAETKTTDAAGHAADVAAWDAIADALAPDGIPAELLGAAMQPINDRLRQSAEDNGWAQTMVNLDMEIVVAGNTSGTHWRQYRLLSESEKWRADAMLAEAIAFVSGARLLVLDRMDVLDLKGRGELLNWLDLLASNSELSTALVFGTLKALPSGLPETIQAHWIENGVAGQLHAAA
jgi:energy-coupling factor transporter ATP-binding protein EcfA2